MTIFKTVNRCEEIDAIKLKYGQRFFANKDAVKDAGEVWGCSSNEHGVCRPLEREIIVKVGQCEGGFSFYKTNKNYWLCGLFAMSSYSGRGYAPSVWDSVGFPSYEDARLASVIKLIHFFEAVAIDKSSCNGSTNRRNATKAVQILEAEKMPQLSLF